MPTNLALFLAFVSGFLFLRLLNVTRYSSQTWEGPRLIFWTGAASAALLLLSRLTVLALDRTPLAPLLHRVKAVVAPWDFAGTIGFAVFFGIALPLIANMFLTEELSGWLASRGAGSGLHRLLYDIVGTGKAICVTMSDRKVYVGLVVNTPRLHPGEKYFELLPIRSGYRDKDTSELRLTVDYSPLVRALREGEPSLRSHDIEEFLVLLPFEDVASARVFDEDLFTGSMFIIKEIKTVPSAVESGPRPPENVPASAETALLPSDPRLTTAPSSSRIPATTRAIPEGGGPPPETPSAAPRPVAAGPDRPVPDENGPRASLDPRPRA